MSHRIPLGDTGWSVWRDVLLRSAGFPVDGLAALAAPEAADAADALLAGDADVDGRRVGLADTFDKAFEEALRAGARELARVAADPAFQEAVTWQNPSAMTTVRALATGDPDGPRNVRRRDREKALLRYWQRYCAKSETIGFFGPVCWGSLTESPGGTRVEPGPALVARRQVFFETWALEAYADRLAADPDVRRWWPPVLAPHLTRQGRQVVRPVLPPVEVSRVEEALLASCDGRTPAWRVVELLRADSALGVRTTADGFLLLDRLVERDLLRWDAALPLSPDAEEILAARIAAIGDPGVRERAEAGFDQLRAGRDAVAAAAGDPEALGAALAGLDAAFAALTGQDPRRRSGQMYAGRTLVYEDTSRDLEFRVGPEVLEALAAPLAIVLRAARWLTAEIGAACAGALAEIHADLAVDGPVRLDEMWYHAQGVLLGAESPVRAAGEVFTARWAELLGLGDLEPGRAELRLRGGDLAGRAAELFAADRPGWSSARVHSPDVQICARDVAAINRGEFLLVLGELHPAIAPFDSALFSPWHPDRSALRAALDADLGPARLRVLYPEGYPRQTGRTRHGLDGPLDRELAIDGTRGGSVERGVAATSVRVESVAGELVAVLPDGARWPLIEVFGNMLGAMLLDSFKLLAPAAELPRITIDRLVVARRTWRTTVGETGLAGVTGERDRYLAARRWRAARGLPDRFFVKIGTETKPCYVDLTGPAYAQTLCSMLRSAARDGGDDVGVVVSELLPDTSDTWLTDAAGRGYVSELRLQIVDQATPRSTGGTS